MAVEAEGRSGNDTHVFAGADVKITALGAGAEVVNGNLKVTQPGTIALQAIALQTDNPTIQSSKTPRLVDSAIYQVYALRAVLFCEGNNSAWPRRVPVGIPVTLDVKAYADCFDVSGEIKNLGWATPSGTSTVSSDVPCSVQVGAYITVRGVRVLSNFITIEFYVPPPSPPPPSEPQWQVSLAYTSIPLGTAPPKSLLNLTLGSAMFSVEGTTNVTTCPFVGSGYGVGWTDLVGEIKDAGIFGLWAELWGWFETFEDLVGHIRPSSPYPIRIVDASPAPTTVSAFTGVWTDVSVQVGTADFGTFGKRNQFGEMRYVVDQTGGGWFPSNITGSASVYYFAPSFEDMAGWLWDVLTQ